MKLSDVIAQLPVYDPRKRCATPKPDRFARRAAERKQDREQLTARDRLRRSIYQKDQGKCRCCGRRVFLKIAEAPHVLAVGQVHEWIPRSLGGDPLEPTNCLLLCSECHPKVQGTVGGRTLLLVALDVERLMRGTVETIPNEPITLVA